MSWQVEWSPETDEVKYRCDITGVGCGCCADFYNEDVTKSELDQVIRDLTAELDKARGLKVYLLETLWVDKGIVKTNPGGPGELL